jgi:hypothetical protein
MRRHVLIAGCLFLLSGLAAGVWAVWPPPPGVTLENFRRLRPGWDNGMTDCEVQKLFGDPGKSPFRVTGSYFRCWRSGDVQIVLVFSEGFGEEINGQWSGRLERGGFCDGATGFTEQFDLPAWQEPQETMLQRFRRWVGI